MNASQLQASAVESARLQDALTASFAKELAQVVKLLNRQIRALLQDFETERGRVVSTAANLGRAVRLRTDLVAALRKAGYRRLAESVTDAPLDRLAEIALKGSETAATAARLTAVDVDALAALKGLQLAKLFDVEADVARVLWETVLDGVLGARPVLELVTDLEDVLDVSQRQARVLYDTAVSSYTRHVHQLASTGEPDEVFAYLGPVDTAMREFCREHVGKVYTRDRIDALDNGIKGFRNVWAFCGGPNCRHVIVKVSALDTETLALVNTGERIPGVLSRLDAVAA